MGVRALPIFTSLDAFQAEFIIIPPSTQPGIAMESNEHIPLAHRVRPKSLEEVLGQEHITGKGGFLYAILKAKRPRSMIFWGPPGSGKTTLAQILFKETGFPLEAYSAVSSGIKEIRDVMEKAKRRFKEEGRPTILFVDELHRFNKAQQAAFLPYVERGIVVLVGATTQNPSFEIIPPLLSRCRLLLLKSVEPEAMRQILLRALSDKERGLGKEESDIEEEALELLIKMAHGDARVGLNSLEAAYFLAKQRGDERISAELVKEVVKDLPLYYDKAEEEHYNLISAFIKSMRGSDPQATLYWLYRMLEAGEDRRFILRRIIRFASEDVGMKDPFALVLAVAAAQGFEMVGSPEGELLIAQAGVYMAEAPKDNSLYVAEKRVLKEIRETGHLPVPLHLRNPVTRLMEGLGYGKDYVYPHDEPEVEQDYMPEKLKGRVFYESPKEIKNG